MSGPIDFTATCSYLSSLKNKGIRYNLDSPHAFAAKLGHPEKKFPCIHVAGTNGKGSTCAMIEAIYRANGYKTGLYTSPHLVHEGELVQVNRRNLSEAEIILYIKQLKSIAAEIPGGHPSFFELMTIMAFLHFVESKIDLAIIETGVGGRLDATNIVDPELSIITSISLDHTDLLGSTIDHITKEKAGIIKPGKPALIGNLNEEAEAIIRQVANEKNCTVYSVREYFPTLEKLPETNLCGLHQRWNAAVAIYATEILNQRFPVDPIRTAPVLNSIRWPGRWQVLRLCDKTLILDASHNQESAEMLRQNLENLIQENQMKPTIIVGTTSEIRAQSIVPVAAAHARKLHLVTPEHENAIPSRFLETYLPEENTPPFSHNKVETIFPAPEVCAVGEPGETIVVTGSLYLVGEVLKRLAYKSLL